MILALALSAAGAAFGTEPALGGRLKVLHVIDRLTYGPRPGDVDRVSRMGAEAYIDRQLHPERIDDAACARDLSRYPAAVRGLGDTFRTYWGSEEISKATSDIPVFYGDLAAAKLTRAVSCERQLEEIMTDFWFNHFTVSMNKIEVKLLVPAYEREVIRPRVFGKFRDLLGAVARSPAMMIYLDNYESGEAAMAPGMSPDRRAGAPGRNENYARELMELHTVGVHGGYAQRDVAEASRVLTGWSLEVTGGATLGDVTMMSPALARWNGEVRYRFDASAHDSGTKTVMGAALHGSGEAEGEALLDLLAYHPGTARFVAFKLCQRFVDDDPPPGLVDKVADRFLRTRGDIRQTLRALFTAPEFYERRRFRSKIKSPFEFYASLLRATGTPVSERESVRIGLDLYDLGQLPYRATSPAGFPERTSYWVGVGDVLTRLKKLSALAAEPRERGRLERAAAGRRGAQALTEAFSAQFLGGELSSRARAAIVGRLGPAPSPETAAALVLGSPDFERR